MNKHFNRTWSYYSNQLKKAKRPKYEYNYGDNKRGESGECDECIDRELFHRVQHICIQNIIRQRRR